jgi:hypothetical protein
MKTNLLEKQNLICSLYLYKFRKYVSYDFPIINFSNPGEHYEKPCILWTRLIHGRWNILTKGLILPLSQPITQSLYLTGLSQLFIVNNMVWRTVSSRGQEVSGE